MSDEKDFFGDDSSEENAFEENTSHDEGGEELNAADADADEAGLEASGESVEGSELESFESAEIEEKEFIEDERIESIIESYLFATDRPVSLQSIRALFTGTQVNTDKVRKTLDRLAVEYAGARRGVVLEEVSGGYQLRTKMDNLQFLKRSLKARTFKLSGPALEVLSIVAYKQPVIKNEIDQIRGVESGHLLRALMEKGLITFEGKSDLPGKPMQYATARKFLEIFGLRNIRELPSLSQIDELLPEGIGDEENELGHLSDITSAMGEQFSGNYSQGEDELVKIESQLSEITTTSAFFEDEKRQKAEAKKAKNNPDFAGASSSDTDGISASVLGAVAGADESTQDHEDNEAPRGNESEPEASV